MQKSKLLFCLTEAVATLGASNSSKNAGKLPFLFSSAESSNYPKILAASKLGQNIERIKQQLPGKTFSLGPLACLGHFPLSFVDTRLCAELLVLPAPQCGCCHHCTHNIVVSIVLDSCTNLWHQRPHQSTLVHLHCCSSQFPFNCIPRISSLDSLSL